MTKKRALTISLLATISISAIAAFYISRAADGRHEALGTAGSQAKPKPSRPLASEDIQKLANQRKISPSVVRPELGSAFSINRNGPLRPPGDALRYARSLLLASESGDAIATYDIFLATLDCANRLRNAGVMYQEVSSGDSSLTPASHTAEEKEKLLECEGLLTSDDFAGKSWLKTAAEQGSVEAMLMYSTNPDHVLGDVRDYSLKPDLVQKWKDDSMVYLTRASSVGSTDALYTLSDVYRNGIIAPHSAVDAYAYRMAADKATGTSTDRRIQTSLTKGMTPIQIREAERRSQQILHSCCTN